MNMTTCSGYQMQRVYCSCLAWQWYRQQLLCKLEHKTACKHHCLLLLYTSRSSHNFTPNLQNKLIGWGNYATQCNQKPYCHKSCLATTSTFILLVMCFTIPTNSFCARSVSLCMRLCIVDPFTTSTLHNTTLNETLLDAKFRFSANSCLCSGADM